MNSMKDTDTSKQIIHISQKTKVDASWKEARSKKRNRNSFEISTQHKWQKMNKYQLNKTVPTINSFEGLKKELYDET